jgi:hypothetical protein
LVRHEAGHLGFVGLVVRAAGVEQDHLLCVVQGGTPIHGRILPAPGTPRLSDRQRRTTRREIGRSGAA